VDLILKHSNLTFFLLPFIRSDSTLLDWSSLNAFLFALMMAFFGVVAFAVYGDKAYGNLDCVRSPHAARAGANNGANLTPRERAEDQRMKMARISIEHFYGLMGRISSCCTVWSQYKLREEHPYAAEQVRVCHLLTNCYIVCHGSLITNAYKCDQLLPNSLADYLRP
jgi:hypothetical protein